MDYGRGRETKEGEGKNDEDKGGTWCWSRAGQLHLLSTYIALKHGWTSFPGRYSIKQLSASFHKVTE